jgi:hypothetical protein
MILMNNTNNANESILIAPVGFSKGYINVQYIHTQILLVKGIGYLLFHY